MQVWFPGNDTRCSYLFSLYDYKMAISGNFHRYKEVHVARGALVIEAWRSCFADCGEDKAELSK